MYILLFDKEYNINYFDYKEYNKFINYFNRFNNSIINKCKCTLVNYFIKCNLKELIKL
jgi:hypothetical protein